MIDHDNLSDYIDPILYDLENQRHEPAENFYLTLARQFGGPILEMGCGTGRFTIPLAQHGFEIIGLDIVPGMLAHAKEKAGQLPIQWVEADSRHFHLGQQFNLIFESGAMFQHLLTRQDSEAMLTCVRAHLTENGRFLIHATFTRPNMMISTTAEQEWFNYDDPYGRRICVSGTDRYDAVHQIRHETAVRRWQNETGETIERIAPLALRQYFPQELETLLHYNGFEVIERYGDWDFSKLSDDSPMIMYLCKAENYKL